MKSERYFGVHFDFHAGDTNEIGIRTNKADIEEFIKKNKLDYIQCGCKGHPGIASYPTEVGTPAKGLVKDNLRIWVDAAKNCNVPIYVHYSGIDDGAYCKKHPENSLNYYDDPEDIRINVFSDEYVEKLLIPQLKELIDKYDIDGVWVDGDCWALGTKVTGKKFSETVLPYIDENISMTEYAELLRKAFRKYLKRYVDELHRYKPSFNIISNWAYSSYMPEKPGAEVDYLSGDVYSEYPAYFARCEGRCFAAQGISWDLMMWSFSQKTRTYLPLRQMCRDAAIVNSLGGGYCTYINQNRDGSMKQLLGNRIEKLSEFVHKRKFNYNKKMLSQTAIFFSEEAKSANGNVFAHSFGEMKAYEGMLSAILDTQYTCSNLYEYQIDEIERYECVIVPGWDKMSTGIKEKLLKYAKGGGKLLVSGAKVCSQIGELCGAEFGIDEDSVKFIMDDDGGFTKVTGCIAKLDKGDECFYENEDLRDKSEYPSFSVLDYGEGSVAFIPFAFGERYKEEQSYILLDYLKNVLDRLITPLVKINRRGIDVTLLEDGNDVILNVVNMTTSVISPNQITLGDIPEIYDVEIEVKGEFAKVEALLEQADNVEVMQDCIKINLKSLDIHNAFRLIKRGDR